MWLTFRSLTARVGQSRNDKVGRLKVNTSNIFIMAGEDSDTGIKIYLREIGQIPLLTPLRGDRAGRAY